MPVIVGIDTGGTHTDAVLIDTEGESILCTSKVLTTHFDLSIGIKECLENLLESRTKNIERIMLSTTLATNAVVEGKGQNVGVIFIGKKSHGSLPTGDVAVISGKVNAKGREIAEIEESEIDNAMASFTDDVDAIAISGFMSVRNPSQEIFVKKYINRKHDLPIVCGHELSTKLGFHERTVTAILNAGLLPIISEFLLAIEKVLNELSINAEIFIVRGDGSVVNADSVLDKPVETILSGPTASVIGARHLTGIEDCIVCDIGGTTTDTSYLSGGKVALTEDGAKVGEWKTMIRSLDIHTFGLGGDSRVIFEKNGDVNIGPGSVLPACRGGKSITPTDILHYTEDFDFGDKKKAVSAINKNADILGKNGIDLVYDAESKIIDLIQDECIGPWNKQDVPVIAIGAAAGMWLKKWNESYVYDLIVPEHYEVANAVGAGLASIKDTATAIVRPGENNYGFVAYMQTERKLFMEKETAIEYSISMLKKEVTKTAKAHGARGIELLTDRQDVFTEDSNRNSVYVETQIQVIATGRNI